MEHQVVANTEQAKKPAEWRAAVREPAPESSGAVHLMLLQRSLGNRALGRFLQAKLKVSAPGDRYEDEADRVAEQVMQMATPHLAPTSPFAMQRKIADEEGAVQMKPLAHAITPAVQSSPSDTGGSFHPGADFEARLRNNGDGSPLTAGIRAFMEPRFGADFSRVRLHTGGKAAQLNRAIGAEAFTHGQDIYLSEGKGKLESDTGKHLLSHELTHTIQQRATKVSLGHVGVTVQRQKARKAKTSAELKADFVKEQVKLGRFGALPESVSEGEFGPPQTGGAFWMLNGLSPEDMHEVLRLCGESVRTKLLAHIAEADGRFDRPRLESALRSTAWQQEKAGIAGLEIMHAIRNAGTGSFVDVWGLLAGKSRANIINALRTLPRESLTELQTKLSDAPASDRTMLTEVILDLLGTGTNMQATDVIDLKNVAGLDRVMASIYNLRGQLIEERARDLGIPTSAAAGIMQVESGGATFGEVTNRTIVRFENHVFWDEWGLHHIADFNAHFDFDRSRRGKRFEHHRFRDSPTRPWEACHQSQEQEWRIMEFAATLSGEEAAYRSASWGAGQIMGRNAATVGFRTAVDMAAAFNRAERPQIAGIFDYIRANRLQAAVVRGDFLTVASGYNGTGQAAAYAARITNATAAYQRVTSGKIHVIP